MRGECSQGASEYTDCTTLLTASSAFAQSSLFQICTFFLSLPFSLSRVMLTPLYAAANGVPASKILIGKPASTADASNGFMTAAAINTCVRQAKARGWMGGLALFQYPNQAVGFVATVSCIDWRWVWDGADEWVG